jgi:hypothetical protein
MTPKMIAALKAAEAAGDEGLAYFKDGWRAPGKTALFDRHDPVVVSRLLWNRKFLTASGPKSGPRQRRHINEAGRAWLAEHRKGERS